VVFGDTSPIPVYKPGSGHESDSIGATSEVVTGTPRYWREKLGVLRQYSGPIVVVAVVLVIMAGVYYFRWGFHHRKWATNSRRGPVPIWLVFNDLGSMWSSPIGEQGQSIAISGYDGQFFFYIAQNPGVIINCSHGAAHCPIDANPLREERILYPMTARLLTLGNADLLHPMLFLIDLAAILITVFLVALMCVEAGASKWLSVAAGIFAGEVMGLLRDLAEPYAIMWVVLTIYLLRKNRPLWCAVAVAAAVLTREQLVLVLPLLALPLLTSRRFGTLLLFLAICLTPFVVWQITLYRIFGRWGLLESLADTRGLHLPFAALLAHHSDSPFGVTVVFVALPIIISLVLVLGWIRRHGIRALLADPVPLIALIYGVLATLTSYKEWGDIWAATRIVAPLAVLGILIACGVNPRYRTLYAVLMGATVLVMFFTKAALY
jgi:hypothetical protein